MRRLHSRGTFEHLLSPIRLGPIELTNRVVLSPMDMNMCDDGEITDSEIAHYVTRAAGGTAMVITGTGAVAYPIGATSHTQPGFSDDRFIPGLRRLADGVHAAGGRLCLQICHHGKTARVDTAEGRALLVPSIPTAEYDTSALRDCTPDELRRLAAASGNRRPTYTEASDEDLLWVIDQFAQATRRIRAAGADAVEIHAAHGYLLSGFLSAADNRRTDRWGGSLENRARLTCEVIAAVREAAGAQMAVTVRVSGREYGEAGALSTDEAAGAARMFEAAGAEAIHVTGWGRNPFDNFTDGPVPDQLGQYRELARAVKAAVRVPVIAVGRILPEMAEEMIAGDECDLVAMGRQLLADPELVNRLRAGRRESIRPCINCYVCVEQNFFDASPRCAVNPALGNEPAGRFSPVTSPRHVVVVGGGPAGMETARIARRRGHRVTLVEASDRLGGTVWFSQLTTPANGPLIDWLVHELDRLDVVTLLQARATVSSVRALAPDVVVVATGASRGRPPLPGADLPHVHTGDSLRALVAGGEVGAGDAASGQPVWQRAALRVGRSLHLTSNPGVVRAISQRWMPLGERVVVVGGGLVGVELAEFLAERGRQVTVVERGPAIGLPMAMPRRWTAVRHAREHGVTLVRGAEVIEITASDVAYRRGEELVRVPADTVVIAEEVTGGGSLADELRDAGLEVHVVGDAGGVGYIEGAIHSAWPVAASV